MASVSFVLPVPPDKLDAWKAFHEELDGPRRRDFEAQQRRIGLVRHRVWLQDTTDGALALVVQEGDDPERARGLLAASTHPFDRWFREQAEALYGPALNAALAAAPPTTLYVDYLHTPSTRGPEYDLPDFNA